MIVSFSGIDGAGKSTQIRELETWLNRSGFSTRLLTFWDDVVVFSRYREFLSNQVFKGDQGIGSPAKPLNRRDKNVTSWPVTALRFCLYFADALNLCLCVSSASKSDADVVIFDRYIYDELANLPLHRRLARAFVWLALKLAPKPDLAYVIDADPVAALARKPEYPLPFLRRNREAYIFLAELVGDVIVIEPGCVATMRMQIRAEMLQKLSQPQQGFAVQ
jgi:thymidylate kinase